MGWGFTSAVWLNGTGQIQGGTNRDVLFEIKECLVAAGATITASSNTIAYLADGTDLIDSGTTMAINGAWFELKVGASGPWYSVQHVSGGQFRVKRSSVAFSGGSPGFTRVTGGGEVIHGGGSDASPSGGSASWMDPASPGLVVGGADAAAPYGFWFGGSDAAPGGATNWSAWLHDPVTLPTTGDTDPAMSVIGYSKSGGYQMFGHTDNDTQSKLSRTDRAELRTPWGYNVDGALWDSIGLSVPYGNRGGADWPTDGVPGERAQIGVYIRPSNVSDPTVKGTSSLLAWVGPRDHFAGTHDWRGDSDALIQIGECVLPWNGTLVDANNGEMVIHGVDDAGDTTAPTLTLVSPTEGGALAPDGSIVVDVDDETGLAYVELSVQYPGAATEVMVRNDDFRFPYTGTRASTATGYRYTINRSGGWPEGTPRFDGIAVDGGGNTL